MELHVGSPAVRGGLTVFPVFNGDAVGTRGYDLGGAAVEVTERAGSAVVGELVVRNGGTRPALLLEGELLQGGWQNRVVTRPVMVAAGASAVVEVRCVEAGRWDGAQRHARTGGRAPMTVRSAGGQQQVWQRVARYGPSPTSSLMDTTRDRRAAAERLVRDLRPAPFQTGVLIGLAGQPLLLEVFDSPRTLAAAWDGLLAGVAIDAVGAAEEVTPGRRARRFVRRLTEVGTTPVEGGHGVGLRGASPHVRVTSLRWHGRAVVTVAVNPRHALVTA